MPTAEGRPSSEEEVPSWWLKVLRDGLKALEGPQAGGRIGLAEDVSAYVSHGEPAAVLQELAQADGIRRELDWHMHSPRDAAKNAWREALYKDFDCVPAAVALPLRGSRQRVRPAVERKDRLQTFRLLRSGELTPMLLSKRLPCTASRSLT